MKQVIKNELKAIIGYMDLTLEEIRTAIPKDKFRHARELVAILHDKIDFYINEV